MSIAILPAATPTSLSFDGSLGSFNMLFQKQYEPLCRFAYSFVDSAELAEEIVNDVFVKIWKNRESFEIRSSLQAYLLTAVRNRSVDYLRKAMRRRTQSEEACQNLAADYGCPESHTISGELEHMIESAIDRLPKQGRAIFRLSRDRGMKYHEIAEHLNLSIKTVETHMGRSLKFLREQLQNKHRD
jgi:RNA polymerase sigma-70 factor, ECF subfamily